MAIQNKRSALVCVGLVFSIVLVAAAARAQDVSFEEAQNFGAGTYPISVAVGDFNGDGVLDLAVADEGEGGCLQFGGVSVLLGNGDGSFQAAQNLGAGYCPSSVAVGDFNGDGVLDLAVAHTYSNVWVFLGNGDGTFQAAGEFESGSESSSVAVGDFNGDSIPDLAVTNMGEFPDYQGTVSILLGNGDGSFQTSPSYAVGRGPRSVAVGDFNGDGRQDLVVANWGYYYFDGTAYTYIPDTTASVLLGRGDGTFQPAGFISLRCSGPLSVAVADFNADGALDFAVTYEICGGYVSVLLGNGDGSFQPARDFWAGASPQSVAVGDFNGDGVQDLAVASEVFYGVSVLLGNGDGSFQSARNFGAGSHPSSVAVGDFNDDGMPDLAVANFVSNNVSVLINNTPH